MAVDPTHQDVATHPDQAFGTRQFQSPLDAQTFEGLKTQLLGSYGPDKEPGIVLKELQEALTDKLKVGDNTAAQNINKFKAVYNEALQICFREAKGG